MLRWTEIEVDGLPLRLVASAAGIQRIDFPPFRETKGEAADDDPFVIAMTQELRAYFAGQLKLFETPLDMQGTDFQKRVWLHLESIPFGQTCSYIQVAR